MLNASALVIEEEYLIASDIEETLISAGVPGVEVYRDVPEFSRSGRPLSGFALAVIEARLGSPEVLDFAERLREAGVAVVITSADRAIQSLFTGTAPLEKPFDTAALLAACEAALRGVAPPEEVM
ncbi:hypothetical protein PRN20_16940 [Devosia sp. ZB163]|uniref:hypothetical protein n=1 Tax=Devosia sp. ZB163 TaxID=3025938 RepID=UPI00235EA415|nr:hypothetical protein [Devosia sp. ZB163]MDC9825419.1 hypothetical protein [Devosia sp. ZB163]